MALTHTPSWNALKKRWCFKSKKGKCECYYYSVLHNSIHIKMVWGQVQCAHEGQDVDVQPSKHKTFLNHLYNVGPTSLTLVQHCTNVIQMFCVYWERIFEISSPVSTKVGKRFWRAGTQLLITTLQILARHCSSTWITHWLDFNTDSFK